MPVQRAVRTQALRPRAETKPVVVRFHLHPAAVKLYLEESCCPPQTSIVYDFFQGKLVRFCQSWSRRCGKSRNELRFAQLKIIELDRDLLVRFIDLKPHPDAAAGDVIVYCIADDLIVK